MRNTKILILAALFAIASAAACGKKDEKKKEADPAAQPKPVDPGAKADPATPTPTAPTEVAPVGDTPGGDTPAGGGAVTEAEAEKIVVAMEAVGKAAASAGGDCDKAADAIAKVIADNADTFKLAKEKSGDVKEDEALKRKYEGRLMAAMGGLMELTEKCQDNEKLQETLENM